VTQHVNASTLIKTHPHFSTYQITARKTRKNLTKPQPTETANGNAGEKRERGAAEANTIRLHVTRRLAFGFHFGFWFGHWGLGIRWSGVLGLGLGVPCFALQGSQATQLARGKTRLPTGRGNSFQLNGLTWTYVRERVA